MVISMSFMAWDYFVSNIVISGNKIFLKCFSTGFRWKILLIEEEFEYFSMGLGCFLSKYLLGIIYNKRCYLFLHISNKGEFKILIEKLTIFN